MCTGARLDVIYVGSELLRPRIGAVVLGAGMVEWD